jgi:hypothetical protein
MVTDSACFTILARLSRLETEPPNLLMQPTNADGAACLIRRLSQRQQRIIS